MLVDYGSLNASEDSNLSYDCQSLLFIVEACNSKELHGCKCLLSSMTIMLIKILLISFVVNF